MPSQFAKAVGDLAALEGDDVTEAIADEHVRWELYRRGLGDRSQRACVHNAIRVDPNSALVSAVVIRALEVVDTDERPQWLDILPAGRQREYAMRRARELALLEGLLVDVDAEIDQTQVNAWSLWLQRQVAERAMSQKVLVALADTGGSKRVRNRARQRAADLRRLSG